MRDQYWKFPPKIDIERAEVYTRVYQENEAEDVIVKRAKAFKTYFEERTIEIFPDELIVGTLGKQPRAAVICPEICWAWTKRELDTMDKRPQDPYVISEEDREKLRNKIFPYWEQGRSMEDYFMAHATDEIKNISYQTNIIFPDNNTSAGAGETAADFEGTVLKKGFRTVKEDAQAKYDELNAEDITTFDKRQFYKSIMLACDSIHVLSERYAEKAREKAELETDPKRKAELQEIARICKKVPWEPADTYHEAIQAMWFVQIMLYTEETAAAYCMPRVDYVLYPYYKKDLEKGILTKDKALELMECLWIKLAEVLYVYSEGAAKFYAGYVPFHGVTLGGVDEQGNDAVNEGGRYAYPVAVDFALNNGYSHVLKRQVGIKTGGY